MKFSMKGYSVNVKCSRNAKWKTCCAVPTLMTRSLWYVHAYIQWINLNDYSQKFLFFFVKSIEEENKKEKSFHNLPDLQIT